MILITGGSASGKSAYAEERITQIRKRTGFPMYYLATMQVYGSEGQSRVEKHRAMRAGKGFRTIEQPEDILFCLEKMEEKPAVALLECTSNLVANEMFRGEMSEPEEQVVQKAAGEILKLDAALADFVVVTNTIFEDGMNYPPETLGYARALAAVNRQLAAAAKEVWEVVAGIPVRLK